MSLNQRIFDLLEIKGYSATELSKATGIKQNTISDWKTKGTNPSADKIACICEFLNVSTDYLLTGKERTSPDNLFSPNEQQLLDIYRSSDPVGQERILEHAEWIGGKYKK